MFMSVSLLLEDPIGRPKRRSRCARAGDDELEKI